MDAVADAGVAGDAADLCAEGCQPRRELLGDVAEAPDQDVGVTERCEGAGWTVRLGPAEVGGPFALELVVAHFVEAAGAIEEHAERVFRHCVVVESGARGDEDFRVEAGGEDVVGTRGQRLDPSKLGQAFGGIFQVLGAVGPRHQELGVSVLVRDQLLRIVWLYFDGKALETLDIELQRCGTE